MLTLTLAVLLRWLVNVIGWLALAVFTRCVPNDRESGLTSNWVMPVPVNWKESLSIRRFADFPPWAVGWKLTVAVHELATLLVQSSDSLNWPGSDPPRWTFGLSG